MAMDFTCVINVLVTEPETEIFERVAQLGRANGRDPDWVPETMNEAVAEVLMSAVAPIDYGIEIKDY